MSDPLQEAYAENDELLEQLTALRERVKELEKGLLSVGALIAESHGVYGLHLNGDVAPWDELLPPGRYCEWLEDYAMAAQHTKEQQT